MADNDKKPVAHVVPAILTSAAALIAALTTVYINVRGDKSPQASPAATTPQGALATLARPRAALPRGLNAPTLVRQERVSRPGSRQARLESACVPHWFPRETRSSPRAAILLQSFPELLKLWGGM